MKPGSILLDVKKLKPKESTSRDFFPPFGKKPIREETVNGMTVYTIETPTECPYDFSERPAVCQLALKFNWACSQGGDVDKALGELYNYVRVHTGKVLLDLSPEDCFCVGMAYTTIALETEQLSGERAVNSVSSENAFYCLVNYMKGTGNKSVIPTLFSLLYGPEDLLGDVLTNCHARQMRNAPIHGAFLGPRYDLRSPEFRRSAINYRMAICRTIMDEVYDWDRGVYTESFYTVPTSNWPNDEQLRRFAAEFERSPFLAMNYAIPGKRYFEGVFSECKSLLEEY